LNSAKVLLEMGSLTDGEKNNNNPHKMKDIQSDSTPSELPTKAG